MTLFAGDEEPPHAVAQLNRLSMLLLFKVHGKMTDADLRIHFHNIDGILRRRVELLEDHLVEIVGDTHNANGNRVLIFDLSEDGRAFLEGYGL